jgi:hypothetical protein
MMDILSTLYKRWVDPLAELALASLPLREWPAEHIRHLACWAENAISQFKPRSYYCWYYHRSVTCKNKWVYTNDGGCSLVMGQPESTIEIVPANRSQEV